MHLSVIIPAYNEEQRIGHTLRMTQAYMQWQPYAAEILVVDDGSEDQTASLVRTFQASHPNIHLLHNGRNRGKGFSVRQGFLQAQGDYLLFTDADLSTPIEEIDKLFAALCEPCHIAIGSRALPGSRIDIHQPRHREYLGRLFNRLVQRLVVPGIYDTQCGFKCFRREAALAICERMTSERFGFDVEMLYLAIKLGYRVREVPVIWRHSPQTRVRLWRDAASMLGDVLRIRWYDRRGRYHPPRSRARVSGRTSEGCMAETSSMAPTDKTFGTHVSD
jgi:dolichyl-phosphate beta-glucosyltransferase